MKILTTIRNYAIASTVIAISSPAMASAEGGGGGRGIFEFISEMKDLGVLSGETAYIWVLVFGVIMFGIGAFVWGTSSDNNQGGNQSTKRKAIGFMLAGVLLGSISGIMGMLSYTATQEDTEITKFMGE